MDIGIVRIKPGIAASMFLVTQLIVATTAAQPTASNLPPKTPAFPGAEGYGAVARGGRGGRVIPVTNLNDSGPGSFRSAIEAQGPRIVVFRVSGTIDGKGSRFRITNDFITIAGQTAPGMASVSKETSLWTPTTSSYDTSAFGRIRSRASWMRSSVATKRTSSSTMFPQAGAVTKFSPCTTTSTSPFNGA